VAGRGATVVVALDSVSQLMDLSPLRDFSRDHGGAYYEHAVSPGLMTNSTWTAVLMHRPVHDTGVLLTFQSPDWSRSRYNMLDAARRQGYETWSYFSDQSTAYVGSLAGAIRAGDVGQTASVVPLELQKADGSSATVYLVGRRDGRQPC
jgi:hypothetical protein